MNYEVKADPIIFKRKVNDGDKSINKEKIHQKYVLVVPHKKDLFLIELGTSKEHKLNNAELLVNYD